MISVEFALNSRHQRGERAASTSWKGARQLVLTAHCHASCIHDLEVIQSRPSLRGRVHLYQGMLSRRVLEHQLPVGRLCQPLQRSPHLCRCLVGGDLHQQPAGGGLAPLDCGNQAACMCLFSPATAFAPPSALRLARHSGRGHEACESPLLLRFHIKLRQLLPGRIMHLASLCCLGVTSASDTDGSLVFSLEYDCTASYMAKRHAPVTREHDEL
ncbi:unnamed protein product [Symbiodinium pilosum]|uniref:Uncharacterized protein n=1 Tax=Symbiodinium pilosum TaxID=2952 RepID=A0A812Y5Q4_SYMPI|nr:unnamed protein product [Symbiodinium pilosum]